MASARPARPARPVAHELVVRLAGPGEHRLVHELMLEGFAGYRELALPSSALAETLADVEAAIRAGGAVLAFDASGPVASARFALRWAAPPAFDVEGALRVAAAGTRIDRSPGGALAFSRMAVLPRARRRGVGRALVAWLERLASDLGLERVEITVRSQQPDNRPYYAAAGYRVVGYSDRYGIADMVTRMEKDLAHDVP